MNLEEIGKKIRKEIKKELAQIQKTSPDYIERLMIFWPFDDDWIYGSALDTENEKKIRFKLKYDGDNITIRKL